MTDEERNAKFIESQKVWIDAAKLKHLIGVWHESSVLARDMCGNACEIAIDNVFAERDTLLAVARAATEVEHTIVMSDDSMLQAVFKLCDALKNLPASVKAELEKAK